MRNYIKEIDEIIENISTVLGKPISKDKYEIVDRGMPHVPKSLKLGTMGVYTFLYQEEFLKIGKVGPSSNARFLSQHYHPKGANSNLAKSILSDDMMQNKGITEENVGSWIKQNTRRIDILLDIGLGIFALELIEAILQYKYEPRYEGYQNQR